MSGTTMVVVIVCVVFGILYKMYNKNLEFKTATLAHSNNADDKMMN